MLICYRHSTDPYLNMAAEEYFFKQSGEDMCMIWRNEKSVIIGKHQNAYAEVNYPYLKKHNIPVIRRISGGGAVYHDLGNINFTFIRKMAKPDTVDFNQFVNIFINLLQSVGIQATVGKRNSLFVEGFKISGHAEHAFRGKVLHHGTILFNTDLDALNNSLQPGKIIFSKALPSVKSPVANLCSFLSKEIDIQHFISKCLSWLAANLPSSKSFSLSDDDEKAILQLAEEKYKTWQWNFGYSPSYSFQADVQVFKEIVPILIRVENGTVSQTELLQHTTNQLLITLVNGLEGVLHNEEGLEEFILKYKPKLEMAGISAESLKNAFFG